MTATQLYDDIAEIKQNEYDRRRQEAEKLQLLKQAREKAGSDQERINSESRAQDVISAASKRSIKQNETTLHSQSQAQIEIQAELCSTKSGHENSDLKDKITQKSLTDSQNQEQLKKQERITARRLAWIKEQESKKYRQISLLEQEKLRQIELEIQTERKKEAFLNAKKQRELEAQEKARQEAEEESRQAELQAKIQQHKRQQLDEELLRKQNLFLEKVTTPNKNPLDEALKAFNYVPKNINYEGTQILNSINIKDKTTYDKETLQIRLEDVDIDALINLEGYKKLKMEIEQKKASKDTENKSHNTLLPYSPFREDKRPPKPLKSPETFDNTLEQIKDKQKQYRIQNILNWKKNDTSNQMPINRVIKGKHTRLTDEEIQIIKDQKKLLHIVGALQNGFKDPETAAEIKKALKKKEERAQTMTAFLRTTDATITSLEPPRVQTIAPLQIPPDPRKSPVKQVTEITLKAVSDGGIAPRVICPGRLSRGSREKIRSVSNKQAINPMPTYMSYKYIQNVEKNHQKNCTQLLQTIQLKQETQRKRQTLELEQLDYKTVSFEELTSQQNSHVSSHHENQDDQENENEISLQLHDDKLSLYNTINEDIDESITQKSVSIQSSSQKNTRQSKMEVIQHPGLPTIQQQSEIDSEKSQ